MCIVHYIITKPKLDQPLHVYHSLYYYICTNRATIKGIITYPQQEQPLQVYHILYYYVPTAKAAITGETTTEPITPPTIIALRLRLEDHLCRL